MGKTKAKSTPKVTPPLLTARVIGKGSGKALTGLFLAFKLDTTSGDGTAAQVTRVLEAATHPGPAPDPTKKTAKKKYDELLKQYQTQIAETPPEPASQFVLGIVDGKGFLQPVHDNGNPWRDLLTGRDPDSYKLAAGEKYKALLIRHPSPDVARALTRLLNGGSGRSDLDMKDSALWGAGAPSLHTFEVKDGGGAGGAQFVIELPESADAYVPRGSADHGGWLLYADMPHAHLSEVSQAVESVARALIALRYPASGGELPYSLDAKLGSRFHPGLQAIVAMFQHHSKTAPWKPLDFDLAQGTESWAAAIGEVVSGVAEGEVPRLEQVGIVGAVTAARLRKWKEQKWMKPPPHLVRPAHCEYLLTPAGLSFTAWDNLVRAFGCEYGMKSGHSFRAMSAGGGGGAVESSNHKLGLAADMTGGRRRNTQKAWPVRFEGEWRLKNADLDKNVVEKEKAVKKLHAAVTKAEAKVAKAKEALALLEDPEKKPPATKRQLDKAKQNVASAERELKTQQRTRDKGLPKAEADLEKAKKRARAPRVDKARTGEKLDAVFPGSMATRPWMSSTRRRRTRPWRRCGPASPNGPGLPAPKHGITPRRPALAGGHSQEGIREEVVSERPLRRRRRRLDQDAARSLRGLRQRAARSRRSGLDRSLFSGARSPSGG
jgi:hypothetical protein